ncbi:MAG TPA: HD domain-containing phosphohydrolase [Candidatus Acidoferrales bacterium]|nr:HD domain-containing phosphohydrolase [Candidatus Acidoferrales bacterium]
MYQPAVHAKTILVADDMEANRELLREMLEQEGYRIVCVEDGEHALQVLRSHVVELALLDVMMPGRTGFDVCRAVKSSPELRLIPIVLVTSLSNREDRIRGIESGADDFLNKPVHREELLARVRSLLRLKQYTDELESAETVLFSLALSIEAKDPYTEGHCDRLSRLAVALGQRIGLDEELLVALRRAGTVHDIGKVAVPEHILQKPGKLTAEEWKIMREHPVAGERICSPLRSFRHVLPIIRHHHEKLDGSGYPDGLRGDSIPLTARVLTTVDVYDALTTDRPYRKALSPEQAVATMNEEARRGWWDGKLLSEFERLVLNVDSAAPQTQRANTVMAAKPGSPA